MVGKLLNDYKDVWTYPPMARWFSPGLLFALLQNVVLSLVFGRYADRRLMIAALDTLCRSKNSLSATRLKPKPIDGSVWLDFVADLGRGFDSTYAMATHHYSRYEAKDGFQFVTTSQLVNERADCH
jgi:hypothetical protein